MALVFLLYALFASVFVIAKFGLEYSSPFFLVGSRMFLAGILILAYQWYKNPEKLDIRKDWLPFFKLALFNIYLTNVFEFWGLKYLTSFKTCFIYSLSPFLSALLSYFIFSEKLSLKKWLGLIVGVGGFAPILFAQGQEELQGGSLFVFSWAELSVLMATICSVYGWILLRVVVSERQHSPMIANGYSMLAGGAMALVHSYISEDWNPYPVQSWLPFIEAAFALIIISNLVCYNLYGYLLKRFSATFMSFAGFTTPIFTALFGFLFLGEEVTMPFIASVGIVFVGLTVFYQEELAMLAREKRQKQLQEAV